MRLRGFRQSLELEFDHLQWNGRLANQSSLSESQTFTLKSVEGEVEFWLFGLYRSIEVKSLMHYWEPSKIASLLLKFNLKFNDLKRYNFVANRIYKKKNRTKS